MALASRSARIFVAWALAAAAAAPTVLRAQPLYHLTAGLSAGATDNSQAVSAQAGPVADGFVMARAGASLLLTTQKSVNTIAYTFGGTTYLGGSQPRSLSNGLSWTAAVTPTGATNLTVGANITHARLSTIDAFSGGRAGEVMMLGTRPAGALYFLSAGALESFSWTPSPSWHLTQGLTFYAFRPLDPRSATPQSLGFDNTLGLARVWARDELGLSLRLGQTYSREVRVDDVVLARSHRSDIADALATWRHEYTQNWSTELAGGAFAVHVPDLALTIVEPSGHATVTYNSPGHGAALHGAHTATPNIFIGDTVLRDQVELSGFTCLDRFEQLRLRLLVGYEHDRAVQARGSTSGAADVLHLRTGLSYATNGPLTFSLDYTFLDQRGGDFMPGMPVPFQTFRRNMVMASVEARFPYQEPPH